MESENSRTRQLTELNEDYTDIVCPQVTHGCIYYTNDVEEVLIPGRHIKEFKITFSLLYIHYYVFCFI